MTGQALIFKKIFSDRNNISYALALTEYNTKYDVAYEDTDDGSIYYNNRFDVGNRISFSHLVVKGLLLQLGAGLKINTNQAGVTSNIYRLSAGTSAELSKSASLDFSVTSFMKEDSTNKTWSSPASSDHFFDARGTLLSFAMSVKI